MADIFNPSYPKYFGMEVAPNGTGTDTIADQNGRWAGMIRPQFSKIVTSLQFVHWGHGGAFKPLTVSLYADNAGQPGALLASGNVTPASDFTWENVPIPATNINGGSAYWIVVQGATLGGANTIDMRRVEDPDGVVAGLANRFSVLLSTNAGVTWSNQGSLWMGCVGLGYSDGTYEGNGYGDFDSFTIDNGFNQWGEYFQVPQTITVNAIAFNVYKSAAGIPTASLQFVLMNADTGKQIATGTVVAASGVTTTAQWFTTSMTPVSLVAGTNYRLYLTSAAVSGSQYVVHIPKTVNNGNANAMTFGGIGDTLAQDNSGVFSTDATREIPFRFSIMPVGATITKTYMYRVFAPGAAGGYITTWVKDVVSEPEIVTNINGFPGELDVTLARKFDDFGEGTDVALNNRVELWCVDIDAPNGVLIYSGYIADYLPLIDGQNGTAESVTVVLLSYGGELDRNILRDASGNTTITYTTMDPADILTDAIQKYQAVGGILKYTAASIMRCNQLVTYQFNTNTLHEVLDQCVAMAPYGFYWYVDASNVIHFQQAHITPDHLVTLGLNTVGLETDRRLENIINRILITGGGTLYRKYEFQGSQLQYGIYEAKYVDQRLTDIATAQFIANAILTGQQNPEIRSTFNILDNNGASQKLGVNIEAFQVGDTIQIQNVKIASKNVTLWDVAMWDVDVWDQTITNAAQSVLQIISIDYQPDVSQIQASSRLPIIAKRVEEIARQLVLTQTVNNPSAPS